MKLTRTRLQCAPIVDVVDININVGRAGTTTQLRGDEKTLFFLSRLGMRTVNHSVGQVSRDSPRRSLTVLVQRSRH